MNRKHKYISKNKPQHTAKVKHNNNLFTHTFAISDCLVLLRLKLFYCKHVRFGFLPKLPNFLYKLSEFHKYCPPLYGFR